MATHVIPFPTLSYGLSSVEATETIVKDIRDVCDVYRRDADGGRWSFLWSVASFLGTTDGMVVVACSIACAGGEILLSQLFKRVEWTWQVIVALSIIAVYVWANIVISYKLRKAELIRPFAQVEEALTSTLQNSATAAAHDGPSSFWRPPGSSLIVTLRDGRWSLVPSNTIVRGDFFKMPVGSQFPTSCVRVILNLGPQSFWKHRRMVPLSGIPENGKLNFDSAAAASDSEKNETPTSQTRKSISYTKEKHRRETLKRFSELSDTSQGKVCLSLEEGVTVFEANQIFTTRLLSSSVIREASGNSPNKASCQSNSRPPPRYGMGRLPAPLLRAVMLSPSNRSSDQPPMSDGTTPPSPGKSDDDEDSSADDVAFGTFMAVSTACIPTIEKFLQRSVPNRSTDPWKSSKRTKTTFFEVAAVLRKSLVVVFLVGLILLTVALSLWTVKWQKQNCPECQDARVRLYWNGSVCALWVNLAYFVAAFMPMVYRVMIEATDLWGNARLQSLFQWLQDTRLPGHDAHLAGGTGSFTSSTTSATSTLDDSVVASSVDSRMSVSHLPFRNQLAELFDVLTHGLDGGTNLLHTLNSTTSVVFVEKEGVLTESHRTVQELCVAETLNRHLSKNRRNTAGEDLDSVDPVKSPESSFNSEILAARPTMCHFTKSDCSPFKNCPRRRPSSSPTGRAEELRDAEGRLYQPEEQGLLSYAPAASSEFVSGKIVLDLLPCDDAADGLKFYKTALSRRYMSTLRPLATMLAAARMPINEALHQDFSHAMWTFSSTMRDVLHTDGLVSDTAMECLCCLRSLCGVFNGVPETLSLSRFVLLFNAAKLSERASAEQRHVAAMWLFRARDGSMQLFTKGKPSAILPLSHSYFDGERIREMTPEFRRSLSELVAQWKGNGLDCVALGYRPINGEMQKMVLHLLDDHSAFLLPRPAGSPSQRSLMPTPSPPPQMTDESTWRRIEIFPGARSSIASAPTVCILRLVRKSQHQLQLPDVEFSDYAGRVRPVQSVRMEDAEMELCDLCVTALANAERREAPPGCDLITSQRRVTQCEAFASNLPLFVSLPLAGAIPTQCPLVWKGGSSIHYHLLSGHAAVMCSGAAPTAAALLVKAMADQQVFLGMVALKLSTPQDLQQRVASFHEAGIRFVYASREDAKRTKAVGALLGLDTDWNSCISLKPSPEGVRNFVGKIVIPSGIPDIRRHIREVDNVPLQVSLFSDGTSRSILELIKVLQENGEVVTCVGCARRNTNFDIFSQANCSISVAVDSPPICRTCLGRRCIGRMNRHVFPRLPAEYELSAALTSLPCSLQIHMQTALPDHLTRSDELSVSSAEDPLWLAELLYEAFKESRRIVEAVLQTLSFFAGITVGFIGPMLFLDGIFYLPPVFSFLSLTALSLVVLPVICASLLYSPASESIMHEYPRHVTETSAVRFKDIFVHHAFRFVLSSCSCLLLTSMYFTTALKSKVVTLVDGIGNAPEFLVAPLKQCAEDGKITLLSAFGGGWVHCHIIYMAIIKEYASGKHTDPLIESLFVTQIVVLVFIALMSLSYIDRYRGFREVPPWRHRWLLVTIGIVCSFFAIFQFIITFLQTHSARIEVPPWSFWLLLILWLVCIVILDDATKRSARRRFEQHQKYLKLVFATRLGMWSPK